MSESDYYNDGGKDDCCTDCGEPIVFTSEETKMVKSGNVLYPKLMPMKERPAKIKHWTCLECGSTGQNMYLMKELLCPECQESFDTWLQLHQHIETHMKAAGLDSLPEKDGFRMDVEEIRVAERIPFKEEEE